MNTFQGTYVFDAIEPILAWTEGCQGFDISWPTAIKLELLATRITWISKEIQTNVLAMLITGISRIIKILYVYCYIYIHIAIYIYTYCSIYMLLYIYLFGISLRNQVPCFETSDGSIQLRRTWWCLDSAVTQMQTYRGRAGDCFIEW